MLFDFVFNVFFAFFCCFWGSDDLLYLTIQSTSHQGKKDKKKKKNKKEKEKKDKKTGKKKRKNKDSWCLTAEVAVRCCISSGYRSRTRDIKSDALAMSVGSCSHARGTVSVADRYEADEGWSQGDRFWWEALNVSQCFVWWINCPSLPSNMRIFHMYPYVI